MPTDAMPDPRVFPLAMEKAVALEVNGTGIATLMCTPFDLDVLALGHLLTNGIIASLDEVQSIRIDGDASRIQLRCASGAAPGTQPLPSLPRGEVFPLAVDRRMGAGDVRSGSAPQGNRGHAQRGAGRSERSPVLLRGRRKAQRGRQGDRPGSGRQGRFLGVLPHLLGPHCGGDGGEGHCGRHPDLRVAQHPDDGGVRDGRRETPYDDRPLLLSFARRVHDARTA